MRTVEFKMERPGLVSAGDKVKIIEREGTSSYSYIIDPAVAMSGCFAARDRIKSEYGIVKDVRENSRGFYVVGFTDGCTFPVSTGDTELCVGVTGTIFSAVVVVVSSTLVPVSSSLISSTVSTLVFAETSRETGKLQSTLVIPPVLLQLQSCQ